ncbi:amidohydrolase [Klebsiella variicola]|uniref:amidohydrolase n=1 Tax=Klebsiella variicola TaxID=244366 RepID=UPI00339C0A35
MNNVFDINTESVFPDVLKWRRHIHANPDLSFHEKPTADYIHEQLSNLKNIEITRPMDNSVIVMLRGRHDGPTWALRADIDALPLTEESEVSFISTRPGVMHACGHDAHAAMLMGAVSILSNLQDKLHGSIKFIFQPAEEVPPGGARDLVNLGIVDDVEQIFGLHVLPDIPTGTLSIKEGVYVASSDNFDITITGKGGHSSMPHKSVDPIVIASEVVLALQHIVSRNIDPLIAPVLSIATFQGGDSYNVIPDSVRLAGTLRTHSPEVRKRVLERIRQIVAGITQAHEASYDIDWKSGYTVGRNHPEACAWVRKALCSHFPTGTLKESHKPIFSSEDFSSYQEKVPGCFVFVGCGNPEKGAVWNVHNPHFLIDEDALKLGVKTHLALVSALLPEM